MNFNLRFDCHLVRENATAIKIDRELVYLGFFVDHPMPCGPVIMATILIAKWRPQPVLHEIFVIDDQRRKGYGLVALEYLVHKHPDLDACWVTKAGCSLARAFDRKHGRHEWQIGHCGHFAEVMDQITPHFTDADIEYSPDGGNR